MKVLSTQFDFTHGELAPTLINRGDLEAYKKAAQKLRNVVVMPQGGLRRRFGTEFIDSFVADEDEYKLVSFDYNDDESYLLLFTDLKLTIYLNDKQVTEMVTLWTGAQLQNNEIKYAQSGNTLVIVHPDIEPYELQRGKDSSTWNLTKMAFKFFPSWDFGEIDYSDFTFTLASTDVAEGVALSCSDDIFIPDHVGGTIISMPKDDDDFDAPEGRARIKTFTDTKNVVVDIIVAFASSLTSGVKGDKCFVGEKAWSINRGWPASVTFYEGRQIFGGSKSLQQTLFFSVTNTPLSYDEGNGNPNDAIVAVIASDKIDTIKYLVSDKNLQVFTFSSEYISPQFDGKPIQPDNISIRKQASYGIENVTPIVHDNRTFYLERGGKSVRAFSLASDQGISYASIDSSILSPHLINNPVDGAAFQNSSTDDADYLFYINADGTILPYQTREDQNVSAWTLSDTEDGAYGKFKRVAVVDEYVYFIVQRQVDGLRRTFIEKLDFDLTTDCSLIQSYPSGTTTLTGLDIFNGKIVYIIADGYLLSPQTVSGGEVTLDTEVNNVVIGYNFTPVIKPLPVTVNSQLGPTTYLKRNYSSIYVDYYESLGIYINDTLIPFRNFGQTFPYPIPEPETNVYELSNLENWEIRQETSSILNDQQVIEITQQDPLPMTILGIGYQIEV